MRNSQKNNTNKQKVLTKKVQFSEIQLITDLRRESKVLNLQPGASDIIAKEVARAIRNWIQDKSVITQADLERKTIQEVEKYNKDLAFILKERTKLI